jgi:hypothetical protein
MCLNSKKPLLNPSPSSLFFSKASFEVTIINFYFSLYLLARTKNCHVLYKDLKGFSKGLNVALWIIENIEPRSNTKKLVCRNTSESNLRLINMLFQNSRRIPSIYKFHYNIDLWFRWRHISICETITRSHSNISPRFSPEPSATALESVYSLSRRSPYRICLPSRLSGEGRG